MKKSLATLIAVCSIILLSACSSPALDDAAAEAQAPAAVATKEVPVVAAKAFSWDGTWVTNPKAFSAVISGKLITISIVSTDSSSLYWQGTWDAAAKATDGTKIVSNADVEALSSSLLGSQDKTKTFTYANDEITFSMSMMGTTKTIRIKR